MAFRRDNKIKSNFSKITIGLASPEEIKEKWYPGKDYHTMYIGQIVEVLAR